MKSLKIMVGTSVAWVVARDHLRRTLDSKKATEAEVKDAKAKYKDASDKHDRAVREFAAEYRKQIAALDSAKKAKNPFPWREFFGATATVASAINKVVSSKSIPENVIDVTAEVIK